jgi:chemotaxis response regulator CheB
VIVHIGEGVNGHSYLPKMLSSAGPLPAKQTEDDDEIRYGRIYCARPDFHLELEPDRVRVTYGPKQNFTRFAINPLFVPPPLPMVRLSPVSFSLACLTTAQPV